MTEVPPPRLRPVVRMPALPEAQADDVAAGDQREAEHLHGYGGSRLDWSGTRFHACLIDVVGEEVGLDLGRLVECRIDEPRLTTLRAADSIWRTVEVTGGRLAAWEAPGASWDAVRIDSTRIGYLNLRDASLTDVRIACCRIDTLDLTGAELRRVDLPGCVVDELIVRRATLVATDLRAAELGRVDGILGLAGAAVTADQLVGLAPALAAECGILVLP